MSRVALYCIFLLPACLNCHGYAPVSPRQKVGTSRAELAAALSTDDGISRSHGYAPVSPRQNVGTSRAELAALSTDDGISRRDAIAAAMAGLSAEAAWQAAVDMAANAATSPTDLGLSSGTIKTIESGRAAIIPNFISLEECAKLRQDVKQCYDGGYFRNFILSTNPKKADKQANDRWIMPSFYKSSKTDGPFVDQSVGNFPIRQRFKARMAQVKAYLAQNLDDRPTLANDWPQTHEMEFLRYGIGARLQRHTDEHHVEIQRPNGSRLPKKVDATRRSVTFIVYLDDEWTEDDGGELRLHERANPSVARVGSREQDLQLGWLKATDTEGEQPVFLDPLRPGPENENCMLYTFDGNGVKRDLSSKPFANIALHLGGGDGIARKIMVEDKADAQRFHLIDAPKSLVATLATPPSKPAGEDGGEMIRDVAPRAGTLVLFDSVSVPHEVIATNKERCVC